MKTLILLLVLVIAGCNTEPSGIKERPKNYVSEKKPMTLTDEQLKELAEFIPEIVPTEKKENGHYIKAFGMSWRIHYTNKPFEGDLGAILAHLAKREMEKRGWYWSIGFEYNDIYLVVIHPSKDCTIEELITAYHENEYIALWLAIREAVR